ncbi:acyl--CoA ligase [Pseudomonas sp. ABC1]|uniref:class I adenylate-forming enzyme family protein n=1 Tax=Pseudomonas sp. ABC1 TaxID=2748080 RepID=UPI0015C399ED|nr:class I adenylate-forming enzyme family protein [Pseudomonas sp. ABC1]QLF94929.1 acyl--CoA ligase [Pseudomonas sp. ABC1]
MERSTLAEGFLHRFVGFAKSHPEQLAIRDLDNQGANYSYRQLLEQAEQRRAALSALKVKPEDRVAIILPNGMEFIACYMAVLGSGAIPVILNCKLTGYEMEGVMAVAAPALVITSQDLLQQHGQCFGCHSLLIGEADEPLPAHATPLAAMALTPHPLQLPEGNPLASIQFTYRGVGRPLAVPHRYLDLTRSSDGLHEHFHPQGVGSVHLVTLPLYAIFGLSVMMVFPLSIGATLLMTNTLLNRDLAEVLSEHQVSFACLVPDIIRYFNMRLARRKGRTLPLHPRLMLYSGGSHLPADEAERLGQLLGCKPVLQGYGLTESMPVLVQSSLAEVHRGAMGQPIRGVELRVVDSHGHEVGDGQIGELLIRGAMVIERYEGEPQISERFLRDGWLHTGDLVWRDEQGHVFFYCQRLRISKIKAQMVDLAEVEAIALRHPDVLGAKAYILPDDKEVNVLHLSVHTRGEVARSALSGLFGEYLSSFKQPRFIEIATIKEEAHAS